MHEPVTSKCYMPTRQYEAEINYIQLLHSCSRVMSDRRKTWHQLRKQEVRHRQRPTNDDMWASLLETR